jgi:hypothetical protein
VTVSVTYVAGGGRVTETLAVPLPADDGRSGGTGSVLEAVPLLVGGVLASVAVPLAVYWRRR